MNEDNFKAWVANLRTTTLAQGTNKLCEVDSKGGRHFCCLGIGSKQAGVPHEMNHETRNLEFGEYHSDTLAPYEFMVWLDLVPLGVAEMVGQNGFDPDLDGGFDVHLDMPMKIKHLKQQGKEDRQPTDRCLNEFTTAAGLNDNGFTFAQIADCLSFFGVRRAD
jgi:hypothetical protein